MTTRSILLAGSAFLLVPAAASAETVSQPTVPEQTHAAAEAAAAQDYSDEDDSEEIVITGRKPAGSVIGDIPPENVLTSGDVRATGATNINDLLDAIAPEIGSAQGRGGERPVMLLNGQRISSFRELRDLPTEAISRVEILPEEVALKYGYSATQKVVNIVLRPRFRSTTVELEGKAATDGGYLDGEADVTRLMIGKNGRTSINLHAEGNNALTEDERDILIDRVPPGADEGNELAARSLIGAKRDLRGAVTVNRQLGTVGATGNVELEHQEGRSLIGLGETLLEPLARNTRTDSAHAGFALNGNLSSWRWSVTGNADASHGVTKTDRDADIQDRATTTTTSGDIDATANGNLFSLPAGNASATFKVGADTLHLDSDRRRNGVESSNSLGRTSGNAAVNLDLPVSRRNSDFGALGNLSLNANAEIEQLSDFGTLTTIGAGVNLSPVQRLNLIGSWTREEGPPSVNQLGDPILETPETRVFDFTTGQTVLVNAITGGNPDLQSDRRNVLKLGVNWQPIESPSLRLRADYVHQTIKDPISNFPGPTPTLEAAFPDRFVRDGDGNLVSVDLRPVNYDSSRRDTLRIGFDFSQSLKSKPPSQAQVDAFRSRRAGSRQGNPPQGERSQQAQSGTPRIPGRFGRGRDGGRLTFSLTDTITLVDRVTIRDGLKLDYLHGDAFGQSGGRPRHSVEARAGYFNNGLGARLSANLRSGTEVTTATGDNLHFSPLATFDLRLFANLGQRFDLVAKHPWLRGTSVQFRVDNIFDSKPKVRDAFGAVPLGYQPDLLDPLGRTVGITIRKLFLPPPSSFRRSESGSGAGDE
ncbi:MAG TPA: TonB-dependent receptor [Sphingomicrobium sp.]|nr:TonB-dependent receptor [Sphingomicrobium sp.]